MQKNRNVGIIGVGQSVYSSHREEVNQPEMIQEAVAEALENAGITLDDVDCILHGNMELFEMVHQPDLWHTLGSGAFGKESLRVTTGGTTGATLVCAADIVQVGSRFGHQQVDSFGGSDMPAKPVHPQGMIPVVAALGL